MALRGNLNDFTLPDVFQLIALSRKTGVLRMRRADGSEGNVWFRNGEVFFAESNWHRERLGERLVTAQKITPSALARALQLRAAEPENGRRLGRILVDEGYITDAVLETFVRDQVLEPIFDLMRWEEGEFDFQIAAETPEEDIGLAVSIENIVMEGARRLEEWERIKKKVPSTDLVFRMATAPGEGSFEISLKPIEWNLLLLIDGTRSVAELARAAHWTEFDAARVLYGLFSAGLLEVVSDEEVSRLRSERAARAARAAESAPDQIVPLPEPSGGFRPQIVRAAVPAAVEAESLEAPGEGEPSPPSAAPSVPLAASAVVAEPRSVTEPVAAAPPAPAREPAAVAEPTPIAEPASVAEPGAVPEPPPVAESASPTEPVLIAEASPRIGSVPFVEPSLVQREMISFAPETDSGAEESSASGSIELELAALGLTGTPISEETQEFMSSSPEISYRVQEVVREETLEVEAEDLTLRTAVAGGLEEAVAAAEVPPAPETVLESGSHLDTRGDLGLSTAITDEITALTGVDRASRLVVSAPGQQADDAVPRRDASIDRETLLGIIEGIKRL